MAIDRSFIFRVIETLRAKLLDLSGRNNLISFRHSDRSRKQVRLVNISPNTLYEFLEDSKPVEVLFLPLSTFEPKDEQTPEFRRALEKAKQDDDVYLQEVGKLGDNPPGRPLLRLEAELRDRLRKKLGMPEVVREKMVAKEEHAVSLGIDPSFELSPTKEPPKNSKKKHQVQTLLYPDDFERKLSGIYEQAKLSESETGVNTLFCAFGFLEWYESNSSDKPIYSPLILYPMQLTRTVIKGHYSYSIESREGEMRENICLQERLERDFGFKPIKIGDDEGPESYFSKMKELIKDQPNWKVHWQVTISFFSFAKLVMYHDLDTQNISDVNETVSDLIFGTETNETVFADDYDIDADEYQKKIDSLITDADSSQLSALIDVVDGKNLVIEGPPGTGKSQTISNIISSALAGGKSVLFVAEKRAALEVVKKRLDNAGLGNFCLELHSNKTRKTDVLKSLQLWLSDKNVRPRTKELENLVSEYRKIKEDLTSYVKVLNQKYGNLGKTLHEIVWGYLHLRQSSSGLPKELADVVLESVEETSLQDCENRKRLLRTLEKHLTENLASHPLVVTHPWHNLAHEDHSPIDSKSLIESCKECLEGIEIFNCALETIPRLGSILKEKSLNEIREIFESFLNATEVTQMIKIDDDFVSRLSNSCSEVATRKALKTFEEAQAVEKNLRTHFIADVDLGRLDQELIQEATKIIARLHIEGLKISDLGLHIDEKLQELQNWQEIQEFVEIVQKHLSLKRPLKISESTLLLQTIAFLSSTSLDVLRFRKNEILSQENTSLLVEMADVSNKAKGLRGTLAPLINLDTQWSYSEIQEVITALKNMKWWAFLTSKYWISRNVYKAIASEGKAVSIRLMIKHLSDFLLFQDCKNKVESDKQLLKIFGESLKGIDTNFELALKTNEWARKAIEVVPPYNDFSDGLKTFLLTSPYQLIETLRSLAGHPKFRDYLGLILGAKNLEKKIVGEWVNELKINLLAIQHCKEILHSAGFIGATQLGQVDEILGILCKRSELMKVLESDEVATETLGNLFPISTENRAVITSTLEFVRIVKGLPVPTPVLSVLLTSHGRKELQIIIERISEKKQELDKFNDLVKNITSISTAYVGDEGALKMYFTMSLPDLSRKLSLALENLGELPTFTDYLRSERDVKREGLANILDVYRKKQEPFNSLDSAYENCLYSALLKNAHNSIPLFGRSVAFRFDELRKRFREVDRKILELSCKQLANQLYSRDVEKGVGIGRPSELSELGLIRHELSKQRKHLPIRVLLSRAGEAIKQMKPCILMSPLSVAQYLEPKAIEFDLVVMDEASQLRPEDALGAILRAKQVVIVGDPKQLPPTDFFNFGNDGAGIEDEDAAVDYESVLDLALKSFQPARRLKWHYRSKHESLIAFSNQAFYNGDLIVFPSPHHNGESIGVTFHDVKGIYESGKSINFQEATQVVEVAARLMANDPDRSLGIVAINQQQKDLITQLINNKEKEDPAVQDFIAKWDGTLEPFFVKNLENVQGDERDVIFISTVYGKDSEGNFYQRFGPINSAVGHRRLNVLFTRAKSQMVVFSSIDSEKINVESKSSSGLRAFKEFLTYAKTGRLPAPPVSESGKEPDSDFEKFVMNKLKEHGYSVVPQVGVAGYFIDLAVKHPMFPGQYVLGIECDGATYHSAKCARDRDKTRQEILENLGWKIHRIWSTDWFQNTQWEMKRLLSALPPITLKN